MKPSQLDVTGGHPGEAEASGTEIQAQLQAKAIHARVSTSQRQKAEEPIMAGGVEAKRPSELASTWR